MSNVPPGSARLWAHAVSCVLKTAVTLVLLDQFSFVVLAQQQRARRSADAAGCALRSVLVTHVPVGLQPWDVRAQLEAWYGADAVLRVTPCVNHAVLAPLAVEQAALRARFDKAQQRATEGGPRRLVRVPACLPCAEKVDELYYLEEMLLVVSSTLAAFRRDAPAPPPLPAARRPATSRSTRTTCSVTASREPPRRTRHRAPRPAAPRRLRHVPHGAAGSRGGADGTRL